MVGLMNWSRNTVFYATSMTVIYLSVCNWLTHQKIDKPSK